MACAPALQAVLPENNIDRTMVMLSEDMKALARDIDTDLGRFDGRLAEFRVSVKDLSDQCDEMGLVLYSQDERSLYGALQATQSMRDVISDIQAEEKTLTQLEDEITTISSRYRELNRYLGDLKSRPFSTEGRAALVYSQAVADTLHLSLQKSIASVNEEKARYAALLARTAELSAYNDRVLARIHKSIFSTGNETLPRMMAHSSSRGEEFFHDLDWRFLSGQSDSEEWKSSRVRMEEMLDLFTNLAIAAALIFFLVTSFRRLCPARIRGKRVYYALMLGLSVKVLGFIVTRIVLGSSHQIDITLTLESEWYFLALLVTLSLTLRLEGKPIGRALVSYLPLFFMTGMVLGYREELVPVSAITFTTPFFYLASAVAQQAFLIVNRRRFDILDKRILQANLLVTTVCFITSYCGYTILSTMLYLFWAGIVICIMLVALGRGWINRRRLDRTEVARLTLKGLVNPLLFPAIVLLSLTWVAQVYNLTSWFKDILNTPFIDMPEKVGVVSTTKILFIYALAVGVNYALSLAKSLLRRNPANRQGQVAVWITVSSIAVWMLYLVAVLVILDVNRGGILAAVGGASVGIGFALKDTFENFFYGLSLMGGRVRPGDIVEYEGVRGKVLDVGIISTSMVTEDGPIMAMPNRQLYVKNFTNMTRNDRVELRHITFDISTENDMDFVRSLILNSFSDIDGVDNSRRHVVLIRNFGCGILRVELKVWIDVEKYLAAEPAVREAIFKAFRDNGIEAATFLQKIDASASASIMKKKGAFR